MTATVVHVKVKPEFVDDFIAATLKNHAASVEEPGNMRFDVLQLPDEPSTFALYEAYETEEQAAAHKSTPHYLEWREAVADWMAEPRKGVKHRVLAP
jgi:autoinducer 2-degrading protein